MDLTIQITGHNTSTRLPAANYWCLAQSLQDDSRLLPVLGLDIPIVCLPLTVFTFAWGASYTSVITTTPSYPSRRHPRSPDDSSQILRILFTGIQTA